MSPWIIAARPKTLPLAVSGILLGSAIAVLNGSFHWEVLLFGVLTAILLQILSNFANDYGDFMKGTDTAAGRADRMLAADKITPKTMKRAMVFVALCALTSGLLLLYFAGVFMSTKFLVFLSLGLLAIAAAIKYTIGRSAYAYYGLGDVFVLIFFGLVSVCGIYFLHTGNLNTEIFMAGIGCGLLAVSVLNVNNIRDLENDKKSNKITIPVRIGKRNSLWYHRLLCTLGIILIMGSLLYHMQQEERPLTATEFALVFGVFSPIMLLLAAHVNRLKEIIISELSSEHEKDAEARFPQAMPTNNTQREAYNKELKYLSLTTLGTVSIYWLLCFFYV